MREIKFRAWDKSLKFMGRVVELSFANSVKGFQPAVARVQNVSDFGQVEHYVTSDEIENQLYIEQYTGLKDKNGVEIYEGDILQHETSKFINFTVVFKYGCYYAHDTSGIMSDGLLGSLNFDNAMTVIGNIHENPELLEKK